MQKRAFCVYDRRMSQRKSVEEEIDRINQECYDQGHNCPSDVLAAAQENLQKSRSLEYPRGILQALINIGWVLTILGRNEESFDFNMKAHAFLQDQDNLSGFAPEQGRCFMNLGTNYRSMGDYPQAEEFFQKALALYEGTGERRGIIHALNNLGSSCALRGDLEQAMAYNHRLLPLMDEEAHPLEAAHTWNNTSFLAMQTRQYEEAWKASERAMALFDEITRKEPSHKTYVNYIITLLNGGEALFRMGRLDEGEGRLRESLAQAEEIEALAVQEEVWRILTELYEEKRDYHQALEAHKKWAELRERNVNEKTQEKIAALQVEYEVDKERREAEIYRLKNVELRRQADELRYSRETLERKAAELEKLSFRDELTGLYNRRFFQQLLNDTGLKDLPLGLIMGDVNGLKITNDALGHHEGDRLILGSVKAINRHLGERDFACRIGGDEFALFLPNTDEAELARRAALIQDECRRVSGSQVRPSLSLGWAVKQQPEEDLHDVYRAAEERMYSIKQESQKGANSPVIMTLRRSLEDKAGETMDHSRRMQNFLSRLGDVLGLPQSEKAKLEALALYHDIGKVAIPDALLEKSAPLSDKDKALFRRHCEIGYRILNTSVELSVIAEAVLHHHERWDGEGYPAGLKGEGIPLLSRMTAVVEAWDAMTHGMGGHPGIPRDQAVRELKSAAGRAFDPAVVEAFLPLLEEKNLSLG